MKKIKLGLMNPGERYAKGMLLCKNPECRHRGDIKEFGHSDMYNNVVCPKCGHVDNEHYEAILKKATQRWLEQ